MVVNLGAWGALCSLAVWKDNASFTKALVSTPCINCSSCHGKLSRPSF